MNHENVTKENSIFASLRLPAAYYEAMTNEAFKFTLRGDVFS